MFTRILVPVDLAEPAFASKALKAILDYTRMGDTQVRLVTVRQLVPQMVSEYLPADFDTSAQQDTERDLAAFAENTGVAKDRITTSVRVGGVYHEILDEAQAFKADLIVIGSHRPSMATYLLGSNAANIVRHAPCSVLVIRD